MITPKRSEEPRAPHPETAHEHTTFNGENAATAAQKSVEPQPIQPPSPLPTGTPHPPPNEIELQARAILASNEWHRLVLRIQGVTPRGLARAALVLGGLYVIGWLVYETWTVLAPFVVGLAIAYLLLPLMRRLQQFLPRWLAVITTLTVATLVFGGAVALILPPFIAQLNALILAIPTSPAQASAYIENFNRFYETLSPQQQEAVRTSIDQVVAFGRDNALAYGQRLLSFLITGVFTVFNLLGTLLGLLVLPFFIYYVMKDKDEGRAVLDRVLPVWLKPDLWAVVRIVDINLSSYIRGQLLLSFLTAVLTFVALGFLALAGFNVSYSVLIAVLAGVTELIPYVGFVIGVVAAFAVGALVDWQTALAMAVTVFVVKQITGVLLYPKIVGRSVRIHEALILVVLIMLSEFGFIWVILAPPVAGIARDLFRYVYGRLGTPEGDRVTG